MELAQQIQEVNRMTLSKVVRKGSYQGVAQWGIDTSSEITPSRKTAQKWAELENAQNLSIRACKSRIPALKKARDRSTSAIDIALYTREIDQIEAL
jgi:hypothetical protein